MNFQQILAIGFCLSIQNSYAVFPWVGGTDGSGAFTGGVNGWTANNGVVNGTVQNNVAAGSLGDTDRFIDNFSSGTLSLTFLDQARLETTVSATIAFTVSGGGTADLFFNNRNDYDGGTNTWDGLRFGDFTGNVTGIETVITFDSPIASRSHSPLDNTRPIISGFAVSDLGGTALSSYEVTSSYGGDVSDPMNTDSFVTGLSSGLDTPVLIGGLTGSAGSADASASAFNGVDQFLIVRGYDDDGNTGNYDTSFRDRTYAHSQTWNITRDGSASFAAGSSFLFSFDGEQHPNYLDAAAAIPEPTVIFSFVGGFLALAMRRSRKLTF